jgi:hypothetical protein
VRTAGGLAFAGFHPEVHFMRDAVLWMARLGLAACCVLTAVFAFSPARAGLHVMPWDKADHFMAFFAIMAAAMTSFPRQRLVVVALAVSGAGGLIELIQALPMVARDCDVWDWVTENVAIGAVLGLVLCARLRRMLAIEDEARAFDVAALLATGEAEI